MKAAIFSASKDFEDEEYFTPLHILSSCGVKTVVFSDKKGPIIGIEGGEGDAEREFKDFNPNEFSAVVFVGGPGCLEKMDNEEVYEIAKKALKNNCLLAAICIAPVILANAGLLDGIRATVWSSPTDKKAIKLLKNKGAFYEESSVVKDGMIITANGPNAAEDFSRAILSAIYK